MDPKITKSFTELFFVLSGQLLILAENNQYVLNERDVFILHPQIKHIIYVEKCTLFVSCAPQFDSANIWYMNST